MPEVTPSDRVAQGFNAIRLSPKVFNAGVERAGSMCVSHRVSLADGVEVWIRPLRLDDREALTELYGRLGEHSRYQRFFACPAQLPASWADALLEHTPRRLALVAEPVREPHRIVALADYTVLADAESAEVGLLVEDAWQHNGLGRVLFEHLLVLGERRGIRSFIAYVHWSNRRVIHALGRIATIVNCAFEAPVLKFTFTRQHEVGGGPTRHRITSPGPAVCQHPEILHSAIARSRPAGPEMSPKRSTR